MGGRWEVVLISCCTSERGRGIREERNRIRKYNFKWMGELEKGRGNKEIGNVKWILFDKKEINYLERKVSIKCIDEESRGESAKLERDKHVQKRKMRERENRSVEQRRKTRKGAVRDGEQTDSGRTARGAAGRTRGWLSWWAAHLNLNGCSARFRFAGGKARAGNSFIGFTSACRRFCCR